MPRTPQTRANHIRFDPTFHFFLAPATLILFICAAVHCVRRPGTEAALLACGLFLLLFTVFKARTYSMKVQDRVIRLEERIRLAGLAGPSLLTRIPEITEGQWVALRFASDEEAPSLAQRALDERLTSKDIKAAIRNWRPDYFRV